MKYPLNILLAGRNRATLEEIGLLLEHYGRVELTTRLIENGHSDPLYNIRQMPEILIFAIDEHDTEGLAALRERPLSERPHTLVVGPDGDVTLFRFAMRAGARDYLTTPVADEELATALDQITQELQSQKGRKSADLMVVINAKGGSGASVIATNLAHINSVERENRTLLVDMDLQFGAIPSYLNLPRNNGLMKAIEDIETLDAVAIDGIALKHEGGLRVLSSSHEVMVMSEQVPQARLAALFKLLGDTYDEIVVDMPRHLDSTSSLILQHADKIVLVMEASLAHVHDAKRLLQILQHALGLAKDRFVLVVNRYDKNGSVRISDIREALAFDEIFTLPSDFRRVNDSINIGSPLLESARNAPITKGMRKLAHSLRGPDDAAIGTRQVSNFLQWVMPTRLRPQ